MPSIQFNSIQFKFFILYINREHVPHMKLTAYFDQNMNIKIKYMELGKLIDKLFSSVHIILTHWYYVTIIIIILLPKIPVVLLIVIICPEILQIERLFLYNIPNWKSMLTIISRLSTCYAVLPIVTYYIVIPLFSYCLQ